MDAVNKGRRERRRKENGNIEKAAPEVEGCRARNETKTEVNGEEKREEGKRMTWKSVREAKVKVICRAVNGGKWRERTTRWEAGEEQEVDTGRVERGYR